MSLNVLGSLLEAAPQYQALKKSLAKSRASSRVQVLSDAAAFTLATLWHNLEVPTLVLQLRPDAARRLPDQPGTVRRRQAAARLSFARRLSVSC